MRVAYDKLISHVLTTLNIQHSGNTPVPAVEGFSHPFITIAREPGSGGKPIGQEVAKRLKFQFFDQELIEEIAKSTHLRKSIVGKIDEKGRTALQDMMQSMINPDYVSDLTYLTQLCKVILSIAYKGNAVILGRGANFITPYAKGLHVRVTAPYEVRLQHAVNFEGVTLQKAKTILQSVSHDRSQFVKQYFNKDITDVNYYDLTINTTFYRPHEAAEIVLTAFRKKFPHA